MGNAEGEFRGGDDVVLTKAIEGMEDAELNRCIEWLDRNEVFKNAGCAKAASKMDLVMNLGSFDAQVKSDIVTAIKAGEDPFPDDY